MKRSPLLSAVRRRVSAISDRSRPQTWIIALSGGADSVALLHALHTLANQQGLRLVAAHLDHALRPDSHLDAAFCSDLCESWGVTFRTERADVRAHARQRGRGVEEAARDERYAFLRRVAAAEGAAWIGVAHTRDDQAETVLMHLLRGAGSEGLGGMLPVTQDVVRPLLDVSRRDVESYLLSHSLSWREDPSNRDLSFLRNRVRHELLPHLEAEYNPQIRQALARTAALLAAEADALAEQVREVERRVIRVCEDGTCRMDWRALAAAPEGISRSVLYRALRKVVADVRHVHVERLLTLARAGRPSGRRIALPGRCEAVFHFGELRIGPRPAAPSAPYAYQLPVPGRVELPGGWRVQARSDRGPARCSETSAVISWTGGSLVVRTRQPGDRIHLSKRAMSLKRFLMDHHVSLRDRAVLPLVADGPDVLWIPGHLATAEGARALKASHRFVRLDLIRAEPLEASSGETR